MRQELNAAFARAQRVNVSMPFDRNGEKRTIYSLRHTYATKLAAANKSVVARQTTCASLQEEEAKLRTIEQDVKVVQKKVAEIQTRIDDATLKSRIEGRGTLPSRGLYQLDAEPKHFTLFLRDHVSRCHAAKGADQAC